MLTQNYIPDKEPIVSIGIILPEDNAKEIRLEVPDNSYDNYSIVVSDKSYLLESKTVIHLELQEDKINVNINGEIQYSGKNIIIYPQLSKKELLPKSGIKIKNVISGRGFHWQKHIDVYLPDTIVINVKDKNLFLYNDLPLEHYLMCVATSEMNAVCPETLLESQTITARSWILNAAEQKHKIHGLDACNDDCCQRYQGTTHLSEQSIQGSQSTYGIVALSNGQICDARYSKSCGGMMESFDAIWEDKILSYLQVIPDSKTKPDELTGPLSEEENFEKWVNLTPDTFCSSKTLNENELKKYLGTVDERGSYFRWQRYVNQQDLIDNLNRHHNISAKSVLKLKILKRSGGGRIKSLLVTYSDQHNESKELTLIKDFSIRQSLDKSFLFSSAFVIEEEKGEGEVPKGYNFIGAGWGHGVGYCQIGALSMSLKGYSTEAILAHYFPGSELNKIY